MEDYTKYYRRPRPDNRGRLARFLDYYGFLFCIALFTTVLVLISANSFYVGLAIAAILVFAEARIFRLVSNKLRTRARLHRRYFLAGENCLNAILELGHGDEFNALVKEMLSRQEGFTNLRLVQDSSGDKDSGVDLEGIYRGSPLIVKCSFFKDPDSEVGQSYIKEFIGSLAERNCKNGIFVTTGRFNSRAYDLVHSLRGQYALHLIDGKSLVEQARRAGVEVFPSEDKIDRLIQEEKGKGVAGRGLGLKLFYNDAKKAVLYFAAAALLMLVISLEEWTSFSYVYVVFALLNVALGVASIAQGYVGKARSIRDFEPKG